MPSWMWNGMFLRSWKHPDNESEAYDLDTLPDIKSIRYNVDLIEAETLSFAVDKISVAKERLQNCLKTEYTSCHYLSRV